MGKSFNDRADGRSLGMVLFVLVAPLLGGGLYACSDDDSTNGRSADAGEMDHGEFPDQSSPDGPTQDSDPDSVPSSAIDSALEGLSPAEFEQHLAVLAADAMEGRDNLSPGGLLARQYLLEQMADLDLTPMGTDDFEQPFEQGVNLVGLIPGTDPELAAEYVLISGHYDHLGTADDPSSQCRSSRADKICNGAADNAAGVAATLLIARALSNLEVGPRRSILIVFWDAEEDGLLGSRHFVGTDPLVPLGQISAMFSIDIVGTELFSGGGYQFAIGVDHSEELRQVNHAVNDRLGTTVFPVSLNFDGGAGGRSDHKPFIEEGVPALFYGSGSSPEYHTPADEIDVVDTDLAMGLIRHVLVVSIELANGEEHPSFQQERHPHIDDAIALSEIGHQVLEDPAAVGLTEDSLVLMMENWMDRLDGYIESPPQTDREWAEYQRFIDQILEAVYAFLV